MKPAITPEEAHSHFDVKKIRRIEYYSIELENPRRWVYYFRLIHEPVFVEIYHPDGKATARYLKQLSRDSREAHNMYIRCAMKSVYLEGIELHYEEARKELDIIEAMTPTGQQLYLSAGASIGQDRKLEEWKQALKGVMAYEQSRIEYRKRFISLVTQEWIDALPLKMRT